MNQANRQSNENDSNKDKFSRGAKANDSASSGAPLQNKSENDDMINNLKNFDSKLEADGLDTSDESLNSSSDTGSKAKAGKNSGRGAKDNKDSKKGLSAVKGQASNESGNEDESEGKNEGLSLDSFKNMSLEVNKALDMAKGYLAKDKTAPYLGKLGSEVGEQVMEYVQEWAGKNNAKIDVQVIGVQDQTPLYTGVGASAGAGLGYLAGGKVGAALGLIFGAAVGAAASCVTVKFGTEEAAGEQAPVVH